MARQLKIGMFCWVVLAILGGVAFVVDR